LALITKPTQSDLQGEHISSSRIPL